MNKAPSRTRAGNGGMCPSCERYIGPVSRCPYCDADAARPGSLRSLRIAAVVLAGAGLFFLYLMVCHRDMPLTEIGTITPLMNYATVHLSGRVGSRPYVSRQRGRVDYLSFLLDDGTGSMRVSADGRVARALVKDALIPERGRNVDVTGKINARADGKRYLRLQSPTGIRSTERNGSNRRNSAEE